MRYLCQKDKRALPGNLQNYLYILLPPPPPHVVSLTTSPHFLSLLSLSLLLLLCVSVSTLICCNYKA
jgi:hypothetical protein